jgi:hypothetical protein
MASHEDEEEAIIRDPRRAIDRIPHPKDKGVFADSIISMIRIINDVRETVIICDRGVSLFRGQSSTCRCYTRTQY